MLVFTPRLAFKIKVLQKVIVHHSQIQFYMKTRQIDDIQQKE